VIADRTGLGRRGPDPHGTGRRVVSLVPSVTESLRSWGLDPVACTRFCEQPDLPQVGGTKNPDLAAIVELDPDLVVVDAEENRLEDHEALVAAGLDVHVLDVVSVEGALSQMSELARRLGVAWQPFALAEPPARPGLSVFVPIWRRPWMSVNALTYGSDLLARLGVRNVLGSHAQRYPTVTIDEVAALGPDLVLAPTEPYVFSDRHLDELATLAPVEEVDGRDLFWWGVRTPAAIDRLAAQLARSTVGRHGPSRRRRAEGPEAGPARAQR